jgi:ribosomal-protein-alanine N-acetyltransferase
LEKQLFPGDDPWSRAVFTAEMDAGNFFVGAYADGEVLLGYAGLALISPPPNAEAEVHTIAVAPERQHQGVGTTLLRTLLAEADRCHATTFLEVRTDNESAISLYHRHGFEIAGLRKRYYRPSGADAYTMRRAAVLPEQSTVEGSS